MKHINVEKTVMANGLTIISSFRDSGVFSIGVGIKTGSLYEEKENNGISHLIEHMLFKGTYKRSMDDINEEIERLAGNFDIYTTYHQTVLTASIMKDRAKACMDIISDMLMNAVFPRKEFNLEKKVIIEEIKMSGDDAEDWSYLGIHKAAFPDRWHKYHIAGTIKSVRGIKLETLRDFYSTYYVPGNTAISIVSSFSHEEVVKLVTGCFSKWQGNTVNQPVFNEYTIQPQKVIRHKSGIGQCHILYGFDIHHLNEEEEIALALLNKKIGSGANSILFKELRDKRGYAYSVYSDVDFVKGIKMFYIYAAVSQENLNDSVSIIDGIIDGLITGAVKIDENIIKLMKDIFFTDTEIAIESPSHVVDYLLDGELEYGNPLEYERMLSEMNNIGSDDVKKVIDKVFKNPIKHILLPQK